MVIKHNNVIFTNPGWIGQCISTGTDRRWKKHFWSNRNSKSESLHWNGNLALRHILNGITKNNADMKISEQLRGALCLCCCKEHENYFGKTHKLNHNSWRNDNSSLFWSNFWHLLSSNFRGEILFFPKMYFTANVTTCWTVFTSKVYALLTPGSRGHDPQHWTFIIYSHDVNHHDYKNFTQKQNKNLIAFHHGHAMLMGPLSALQKSIVSSPRTFFSWDSVQTLLIVLFISSSPSE